MDEKALLNKTIENIIFTIDTLFKGKKAPQELLNYVYLIATGMILEYGEHAIPAIYQAISNTKYLEEPSTYQKESPYFYQNPANHNYRNKIIELNDLKDININYELQFKVIDDSPIKTLEYLTHEINYILFANKKISPIDSLKVRFNFLTNRITLQNGKESKTSTIDKIWCILQTEEIMKTILSLRKKKIKNPKFNKALAIFKDYNYDNYKVEGLDILVNLLRPLYNKKETKLIINSFTPTSIEEEFDTILGKNSYQKLSKKIESLNNLISNSNNNNNYYILSCEYVTVRNNYINKYINVKYA